MKKNYKDYLEYLKDTNMVVDLFSRELYKILKNSQDLYYTELANKVYSKVGAIEKFAEQKIDSSLRSDIEYWLREFVKGETPEKHVVTLIEKSLKEWFSYITPEDLYGDQIFEEEDYRESLVEMFLKNN